MKNTTRSLVLMSDSIKHFFHVVSNVRPIIWIGLYLSLVPVFALFYSWLPVGEFRIPDSAGTNYGSWLYYSIVTITTLGFGDYTPAHGWAQAITAVEVMCGIIISGLFLNAVGSMKSEIDVSTELERQRLRHEGEEKNKLLKTIPMLIHQLNLYLEYCYAVTTPIASRNENQQFSPDFKVEDMKDMYKPSGLPADHTTRPAVTALLQCAERTSLFLDSLQTRIDLTIWPQLLENCFTFVADCQLFNSIDNLKNGLEYIEHRDNVNAQQAEKYLSDTISKWNDTETVSADGDLKDIIELYHFIKSTGELCRNMEIGLTKISSAT